MYHILCCCFFFVLLKIKQIHNTLVLLVKVNQELDPRQRIRRRLRETLTSTIGTHTWQRDQQVNVDTSAVHTLTRYNIRILSY